MEKYLDHDWLSRLGNVPLEARRSVSGSISGRHRSLSHGVSVEFAEYRKYVPGDDTRRLDWKAFARSDRYYVKEYESDTNLRAMFLIDISGSMAFPDENGKPCKYDMACRMAANLASLAIRQGDAVGACFAGSGRKEGALKLYMAPSRRPIQLRSIMEQMEGIRPEGKTTLARALHELAERMPSRGLVIILSDLYEETGALKDALRHLSFKKHDLAVFHFVDAVERNLMIERPTRFVDMEGRTTLMTEPELIRDEYAAMMRDFMKGCFRTCADVRADYNVVSAESPWQDTLTAFLMSRTGQRNSRSLLPPDKKSGTSPEYESRACK